MREGNIGSCLWWQSGTKEDQNEAKRPDSAHNFFAKRVKPDPESKSDATSLQKVPVAAFDMDQTIIRTKSGAKWPRDGEDWVWLHDDTLQYLTTQSATHRIVIFTNQGSTILAGKSFTNLQTKIHAICKLIPAPVMAYAAIKDPAIKGSARKGPPIIDMESTYRKPSTKMWKLMEKHLAQEGCEVDMESSFFVGDAAGRPGDFSDVDIFFAKAVGIDFKTPEEWADSMKASKDNMPVGEKRPRSDSASQTLV